MRHWETGARGAGWTHGRGIEFLGRVWVQLQVALAGFLQIIKQLVSPGEAKSEKAAVPVHWLPNVPLPGSGVSPLVETLGGALLVCADEEDGNPKGTAAVRLAGALRCCEPSATLGMKPFLPRPLLRFTMVLH